MRRVAGIGRDRGVWIDGIRLHPLDADRPTGSLWVSGLSRFRLSLCSSVFLPMPYLRTSVLAAAAVFGSMACQAPTRPANPQMVAEWMRAYYGLIRAERLTPPVASRVLGYAAVALYEGLAAGSTTLPTTAGRLNGLDSLPRATAAERIDGTLAALAAERVVLDSLLVEALPTTRASIANLVDSLERAHLAAKIPQEVQVRSRELGSRIGFAIVAWSHGDGFDSTRGLAFVPPKGPSMWLNDSPSAIYTSQTVTGASDFVAFNNPTSELKPGAASDRALILNRLKPGDNTSLPVMDPSGATEPYWGQLRPFVLSRFDECPIAEPPAFSTQPGSAFHREAMEVYEESKRGTPERQQTALYWADNPGETGTPVGHWLAIGSQLVGQLGLTADDAARLLVASAVAQADAFIATWGYKYQYNLLRPRTYIRRVIDAAWEPLVPTPPFPAYPSGHSTQSGAASKVLGALLGDSVAFVDSTGLNIGHPPRAYRSFDQAADEAGWSRIYGGIHFHSDKVEGKRTGQCIGDRIVARLGLGRLR